jgi:putative spermidine/putrescine transport system permease protein
MAVKPRKSAEARRRTLVKSGFGVYFVIFLIFIYGPMFAMFILSFQGKRGGTSFPMRGVSLYWWEKLIEPSTVGDMKGALLRSIILALIVMVITALFSTMFAMAFRKRFFGSGLLFYTIMTGIMVPGILLSLGLATLLKQIGIPPAWWSTALGVHVVWTLPFGFLVMMAVFNRFDGSLEEAARDMGASEWTVFKEVTLPLITPGIVAAGLFGFTLSYDEFARTTLLAGEYNTLPLDINASMTQRIRPTLFALGTASTLFSLLMIGLFLVIYTVLARRTR